MKRAGRTEMQWGAKQTCRTLSGREELHVDRGEKHTTRLRGTPLGKTKGVDFQWDLKPRNQQQAQQGW